MANQGWCLLRRPTGYFQDGDIALRELPMPQPEAGQLRIRTVYLSIDPAYRVWANDVVLYLPALQIGETLRGSIIGVVEESYHPDFVPGDIVTGVLRIQKYLLSDGTDIMKVPPTLPLRSYFALYGHIGTTAYFGLEIVHPKAGETLVVSSAAGGVGSLAGQMAKIYGCHVVGIAGTDDRCHWIVDELGFDAAINYRTQNVDQGLRETCPDGIDVYFDNVGGAILDGVCCQLNIGARIALCGMLTDYNSDRPAGVYNLFELILKRASAYGFLVTDYLPRYLEAFAQIKAWETANKIRYRLTVLDGIEHLPQALEGIFTSRYLGKVVIQVAPEP